MTAPLVAASLIGSWLTARETGIRPIGVIPMAAALGWMNRSWVKKSGPGTAVGLTAAYLGAFGVSHPLAKKIGAWPAVLTVTTTAAGAAWYFSDRK